MKRQALWTLPPSILFKRPSRAHPRGELLWSSLTASPRSKTPTSLSCSETEPLSKEALTVTSCLKTYQLFLMGRKRPLLVQMAARRDSDTAILFRFKGKEAAKSQANLFTEFINYLPSYSSQKLRPIASWGHVRTRAWAWAWIKHQTPFNGAKNNLDCFSCSSASAVFGLSTLMTSEKSSSHNS